MELSPYYYEPKTYVLLDPTSQDGESSLDLLKPNDVHVSLVVLLRHASSYALREYAESEQVDIVTAGAKYVDDVADRIASPTRVVETVVADGSDAVAELSHLAAFNSTRIVLLPSSLKRLRPTEYYALIRGSMPFEVGAPGSIPGRTVPQNSLFFRRKRSPLFDVSSPESLIRIAALAEVSHGELRSMEKLGSTIEVNAGTSLIRVGSVGRQCMLVLEGGLTVRRDGHVLAVLGPGQIAGEIALLTGQPCNADVVASSDALVLVMNQREFAHVLEDCPGVAKIILGTAIDRLALAS